MRKLTNKGRVLHVGETSRHLHKRVSKLIGLSPFTGRTRTNPPLTSILSHHLDTSHPVSFDDFKIISSCSFESKLLLCESLLIRNHKRTINANTGSAPLLLL